MSRRRRGACWSRPRQVRRVRALCAMRPGSRAAQAEATHASCSFATTPSAAPCPPPLRPGSHTPLGLDAASRSACGRVGASGAQGPVPEGLEGNMGNGEGEETDEGDAPEAFGRDGVLEEEEGGVGGKEPGEKGGEGGHARLIHNEARRVHFSNATDPARECRTSITGIPTVHAIMCPGGTSSLPRDAHRGKRDDEDREERPGEPAPEGGRCGRDRTRP